MQSSRKRRRASDRSQDRWGHSCSRRRHKEQKPRSKERHWHSSRNHYKLKLSKCELLQKKVTFTGLDVSKDGVYITDDKLKHVDKLSPPKMVSDVKSLLGFTSFLCAHIPYYCEITGPIQDLVVGKK